MPLATLKVECAAFPEGAVLVAGLLPDKVLYCMATRMAKQADHTARKQCPLAEPSLINRGNAIYCMAATALWLTDGDIRGASAMWMPHARNLCEKGSPPPLVNQVSSSCAQPCTCFRLHRVMATRMVKEADHTARHQRALAERSSIDDRGYAISCMAATTLRETDGDFRGANAMWMPHARNLCKKGSLPPLVKQVSCSCA
ncbi:uncharacterized protein LOC142775607 [Rhipicephalus microplus]|uniref:uncharacterized protein LOC142775607 n=1 Tax=Rhipicephalus microplus TaxID=6941 RepID=UPI003F6B6674